MRKKNCERGFSPKSWKILLEGVNRKKGELKGGKKRNKGNIFWGKLTGISAFETFVKLEGEGNVNLHHFHLRYTWRMCHDSSTPSKH